MSLGIGEMILLAGIALVVIGPEKFPDFAKIVLRTINDLRGYMDEVKHDLSREIRPVKRDLDQAMRPDPVEVPYAAPRHAHARHEEGGDASASSSVQHKTESPEPDSPEEEGPREMKPPPASDGYDD